MFDQERTLRARWTRECGSPLCCDVAVSRPELFFGEQHCASGEQHCASGADVPCLSIKGTDCRSDRQIPTIVTSKTGPRSSRSETGVSTPEGGLEDGSRMG